MNEPAAARAWAGLWESNPVLVQMLGLCPLLAVTTTLVNGLVLGAATAAAVTLTNAAVSAIRHTLVPLVRIPVFVLIIASLVTTIDLLMNAYLHQMHQVLGLFIPLIITNCAILAQAETFASREPLGRATLGGLATGLGFAAVLTVLGAMREALGSGRLFAGLDMLGFRAAAASSIDLPSDGLLVAILPPGAFFGLALLLAARNVMSQRARRRTSAVTKASE
jgi:electron transport complex protein RnfE